MITLVRNTDLKVRSYIACQMFGQVINRIGDIADFGHK